MMRKEDITKYINGIIRGLIKTVIIHYTRNNWVQTQFLNNVTQVTVNLVVDQNRPMYMDPLSIRFGDEFVVPESLEHVVSLVCNRSLFENNNIILSKTDNMNVQKIINHMDRIINTIHPHNEFVAVFYTDGSKEVHHGVFTTGNSD